MRIADLHADVLCQLLERSGERWMNSDGSPGFDATPTRIKQADIGLQVFPIFLPDTVSPTPESLFQAAELFWSEILAVKGFVPIRNGAELKKAWEGGKTGALLALESAEGLQGRLWALRLLHRLGLRLLGPTWNYANWACDGAMEPRGAGFTEAGTQLIEECENLGILIDVSHLSDRGFWELAERAKRPFFASHSNARSLLDNPRNLTDEQIRTIIAAKGIVGLTFVPWFAAWPEPVRIEDVLRHVEHVCSLGGERHLAFGSDFDGISRHVQGLEHPGRYPDLINELLKRYPEGLVRDMAGENAVRFLIENL
ncbi:dipeptidase [Cohnella boryungensis]|uniref:Dipeptidase n=1 Tax=Cohnella boryungensis TaxID=768479 RepID=A0ABV8SL53_9BACL